MANSQSDPGANADSMRTAPKSQGGRVPPAGVPESIWRRTANRFWGYDYFVSYHWASGGSYAVALAERLRDRKYDVFLDRAEFAIGDNWRGTAQRALWNTKRLILVATREALTASEPVKHEVAVFTARGRHVIPVVFGTPGEHLLCSVSDQDRSTFPVLSHINEAQLYLLESPERLKEGPSDEVLDQLARTYSVMRRRSLRAIIMAIFMTILTAFSAFATLSWGRALLDRVAAEQSRDAERNARIAEREEREKAERRTRETEARRLAAEALAVSNTSPQLTLLLAVEAYRATTRAGEPRVAAAEAMLLRGLAAIGGEPRGQPRVPIYDLSDPKPTISDSGRWVVTHYNGLDATSFDVDDPDPRPLSLAASAGSTDPLFLRGGRILTAGDSKTRQLIWDLSRPSEPPRMLSAPIGPRLVPINVAFDAAGRHMAVWRGEPNYGDPPAVDHLLWTWDLENFGSGPRTHRGATARIRNAAFSRDGTRVALADPSGVVLLWDVDGDGEPTVLRPAEGRPFQVAFGRESSRLITQLDDKVYVRDLTSPNSPAVAIPDRVGLLDSDISENGRRLITRVKYVPRAWDLDNPSAPPAVLAEPVEGSSVREAQLTLSPDGRYAVVEGRNDDRILWDIEQNTTRDLLPRGIGKGYTNRFSPDGRIFAVVLPDRSIRVWDLNRSEAPGPDHRPRLTGFDLPGLEADVASMSFRPGARKLVATATDELRPARVWDLSRPVALPERLQGPDGNLAGRVLAISADGRRVATLPPGYPDPPPLLWDRSRHDDAPRSLRCPGRMSFLHSAWKFSGDGSTLFLLLTGYQYKPEPNVYAWNTAHPEAEPRLLPTPGIVDFETLPDGGLLACDEAGHAVVWDPTQPAPRALGWREAEKSGLILVLADPTGRQAAVFGKDGSVRVRSIVDPAAEPILVAQPRHVAARVLESQEPDVPILAFDRAGGRLLVAQRSGTTPARIRRLEPAEDASIDLPDSAIDARFAAFSADGKRLVLVGARQIQVWDLDAPKRPLLSIRTPGGEIDRAALDATATRLVTGTTAAERMSLRVWDLGSPGNESVPLAWPSPLRDFRSSADGRHLAVSGDDQNMYLLPLELGPVLELAERAVGRNMSLEEWRRYFPGQSYRPTFPNLEPARYREADADIARDLTPEDWASFFPPSQFPDAPYRKLFPDAPASETTP